jgi:hypothetical protein
MSGTKGHRKNDVVDWKPAFLEAFATYVYRHREGDDAFAAAWAQVEDDVSDDLEEEAVRRAKDGSDTLLIFLLKARRPEKYRENAHITHAGSLSLGQVLFSDVDEALLAG